MTKPLTGLRPLRRNALRVGITLTLATAALMATASPSTAAVGCGSSALVAVSSTGALNRWPLTISGTTPTFGTRTTVGSSGWNGYRVLASQAATGDLYGIGAAAGNLGRYSWGGSSYVAAGTAGSGYGTITDLVPSGDGVFFGRQPDGTLRWYRWLDNAGLGVGWAAGSGAVVGSGWNIFSHVFGGGNGTVYAVRASDGALLWYRNRTPLQSVATWDAPKVIGSNWSRFTQLTSVGGGHIFAIDASGALFHYQHTGYVTGAATWATGSGHQVGSGWTGYTKLSAGPTDCGRNDPPTNLRGFVGGNSIALRWNPPADSSPSTYTIYRDNAYLGRVSATSGSAYVNTARYVDTTAIRGTAHVYRVSMTTTSGATSDLSTPLTATLPAVGSTAPQVTVVIDSAGFTGSSATLALIRETLLNWYPKLVQQLSYGRYSAPTTINVNFRPIGGGGQTTGNTITIGTTAPFTSPNFPGLVLHEATHVLQQYRSTPSWVAEGMAVYATHTIYNDANTPYPASGQSYTDGYSPASYLIQAASRWSGATGLAREINVAGFRGSYSDSIFTSLTGRSPGDWWTVVRANVAIP